jgi:enoyl-CoA hydratase
VVVLAGAGDRAFCVGADLIESIPALASGRMDITAWDPAHLKGARFYKPIVAAIKGLCLGGGFEIALATDIRVASDTAEFQLPEPGLGFVPAGGTLVRLVRQIGYAPAMEILLTARRFSAADMHAAGVLNHVLGAEDVEPLAYRIAGEIAALSPGAVQTIKEATLILQDLPMDDAFAAEAVLGRRTFTSADARQALAAFAQRAAAGKTK